MKITLRNVEVLKEAFQENEPKPFYKALILTDKLEEIKRSLQVNVRTDSSRW